MGPTTNSTKSAVYGELNISSGTTWTPLSATGITGQRVMISAPTALNTCGKVNTGNILLKIGIWNQAAGTYSPPSNLSGGWTLQPTQNGIQYFLVADAALVYCYAANAGDCVEWGVEL